MRSDRHTARPLFHRTIAPWAFATLLALAAFGMSACDENTQFSEGSNAQMEVEPTTVTFSQLPPGQQEEKVVIVRNVGTETLTLSLSGYTLEPVDAPFAFRAMVDVDGATIETLAPGEEGGIFITYFTHHATGAAAQRGPQPGPLL